MSKQQDCINFNGHIATNGYGKINIKVDGRYKVEMAHRAAYADKHGPIPKGMVVMHACDNRACVNTEHLSLGTQKDNLADMVAKGRSARGSSHPNAKLCEGDIPRIMDLLACGCTQSKIAAWFGISQAAVSNIKQGSKWAHVQGV